jgi:N-acetylglutamate synthase-like GNAT family acetyltransferase
MKIRRATYRDIPMIIDIAVESVMRDPLPVTIDREAMRQMAMQCLNPAHFMWVAEDEAGNVVACVGAMTQKSFWYRGLQCSVLLYYTRKPGAGAALLREFARWVKGRSGIKVAVLELEPTVDIRLTRFLRRLGFDRKSINMTYVRRSQ